MEEALVDKVFIDLDMVRKVNFACHQSAFAVLHSLTISNNDPENALTDVRVELSSSPAFIQPKTWVFNLISPASSQSVTQRDLILDGGYLQQLTESTKGHVTITVKHKDTVITTHHHNIELLAANEWGGDDAMPELLAAFCTPNDPVIDNILHEATKKLRAKNIAESIAGYAANNAKNVFISAAAIYAAIADQRFSYAEPPASFETCGQKIRLPSQIFEGRIATCLDSTLLFAAAFEQAGLNPVIAIKKGHAFVGVWLINSTMPQVIERDAQLIRQHISVSELLLIETTFVLQHGVPSFSQAISHAKALIGIDQDDDFVAVIDIKRARAHQIKPLSLINRKTKDNKETSDEETETTEVEDIEIDLPDEPVDEKEFIDETPKGRVDRWMRKLLDLSARNPLLNHKIGKSSLQFICDAPGRIEDALAAGHAFSIKPLPRLSGKQQDQSIFNQRSGGDLKLAYAHEAFEKKQLIVDLDESELDRIATEIYRKTQSTLAETGANTLFLAIGYLRWKPTDKDDKVYQAPLILLPVTLERKSIKSGIKLVQNDDEPRFNTTLLEMLKKDFSLEITGLHGELPRDESGIDVTGIWNKVRHAIKTVKGFEVTENVTLGHFSFAKYLMWKDLVDRADVLKQNDVVKHLIDTPRDPFDSDKAFIEPDQVDKRFSPSDLLTPLPADSSQMAAIATADSGKNFVIIGPPGTGKSQTIANLIAHMLGKGKKVLFVSEKTAALDVVHRRLKQIGLGEFCLELHSNKAKKLDVLNQLRQSWNRSSTNVGQDWETEATRLKTLRDGLNNFVDALHEIYPNGLTAHYAMGIKVRDEALAKHVRLSWPSANSHTREQLNELRELVVNIQAQALSLGSLKQHPLKQVLKGEWRPQWQEQLVSTAQRLILATDQLEAEVTDLKNSINIAVETKTEADVINLSHCCNILIKCYRSQASFALDAAGTDQLEAMDEAISLLKSYIRLQSQLSCTYHPYAWRQIDSGLLSSQWQLANETWWPKSLLGKRSVISVLKKGGAQGVPNPEQDLPVIAELRSVGQSIENLDAHLKNLKEWKSHNTSFEALASLQKLATELRLYTGKLAKTPDELIKLRGTLRELIQQANELLAPDASIGIAVISYQRRLEEYLDAKMAFVEMIGDEWCKDDQKYIFGEAKLIANNIINHQSTLQEWCTWLRRRNQAFDANLGPLITAIEQDALQLEYLPEIFEAAYCTWWSSLIIGENDVLRQFSSVEHTTAIESFRAMDEKFSSLTAHYIAAKLSGKIPAPVDTKRGTSWGTLQHELQKKTRHKPVREMMQEMPDVVTTLAPCLMMSPLSIAQFLPAEQAIFDVVIFDEASQITVWDAIGCLARGKQIIVAGDPKQMPPSNFFGRSDDEEDDADESDLESILDELLGASIPQCNLNLHYRSRQESLIAFSNSRYYDSSLVTFPAPVHPDKGVRLIRPTGSYSRGKARNNPSEARAIVDEIVRRLTSDDTSISHKTIGVVTFNTEQQRLIEDLLDKARSENPSIEWAFSEEHPEPVFVKNLETVQGDERDVIFFSITFGPDEAGYMTMNFGPLNRNGGERRLNVAMTRARSEMIVVSTLHPDKIDLSRSKATAVKDLKHFLEYAERGASAIASAIQGSKGDYDSPFEMAVSRALQTLGWTVHTQVGVSAYRIDLGIVHPQKPGKYLAGIECDGAMYHSSANARERDKIRQKVLEGLGWSILRVWSTDWWTNKAKAIELLNKSLNELLERDLAHDPVSKHAPQLTADEPTE